MTHESQDDVFSTEGGENLRISKEGVSSNDDGVILELAEKGNIEGPPLESPERKKHYYVRPENQPFRPWPYTPRGTFLTLGIIGATSGLAVIGLVICQNAESCTSDAWSSDIWGPQKDPDWKAWCEERKDDLFMSERANAISNFAYIVLGELIIACGIADASREGSWIPIVRRSKEEEETPTAPRRNHITTFPVYSALFGLACVVLGICSFMFHSYASNVTHILDLLGIAYVFVVVAGYVLLLLFVNLDAPTQRLIRARIAVCAFDVVGCIVISVVLVMSKPAADIFMLVVVLFLVVSVCLATAISLMPLCHGERKESIPNRMTFHNRLKFPVLALASLVVGIVLLQLEQKEIAKCHPNSFFQLHSLWHLLTALSIFFMYLFMRDEFTGSRCHGSIIAVPS